MPNATVPRLVLAALAVPLAACTPLPHAPSADATAGFSGCPSLDGTDGSIVDAGGHVWTLARATDGALVVDVDGAPAGFTDWVQELVYVGGVISHENFSSQWYAWSGAGWSAEADPTAACNDGGGNGGGSGGDGGGGGNGGNGGGGSNGALFFDGFDNLDVTFDGSASAWMDHYPFGGSEFTLAWNNEAEYLCDGDRDGYQPFSVADGMLTITATSVARSGQPNPKGLPWSSGTLTSCTEVNGEPAPGLFAHTYGYFEMRARLPSGPGFWPAFVLYPLSGAGEIDIFEVLGNDPTTLYFTLHATTGSGQRVIAVDDVSQAFHTYGCDWQADNITLYIDGVARAQMPTPPDMQGKPYYINIPFSVGGDGSWPGPTTAATPDPGTFQIDYVGAWPSFAAAHP